MTDQGRTGFFIPYRYVETVVPVGTYDGLLPLFGAAEPAFAAMLDSVDAVAEGLRAIAAAPERPGHPRFTQDWFPTLDAAVAYAMVRHRRPGRIVEIGAGHSTRFLARAVADGELATTLTTIDPAPRAVLGDAPIAHVACIVQRADPAVFAQLAAGDALSIDSSHIMMPGSDVDVLVNDRLPRLPAGVLVHIHDIMLPDGYPEAWRDRGYNEQNAIAPLLQGGGYRLLFASHYVATRMAERLAASVVGELPAVAGAPAGSLWLQKLV